MTPATPGKRLIAKELGLAGLNLVQTFQSYGAQVMEHITYNQQCLIPQQQEDGEVNTAGDTSFLEIKHDAQLLTDSDVRRVEVQLEEENSNYNNSELNADILKSKIMAKATEVKTKVAELRALEEEYDVNVSRMAVLSKQVGKWRTMLHKSGNCESVSGRKSCY